MTAPAPHRAERTLRRLDLAVRRRLDGLLQGDHGGLRPGPGGEPDAVRPYSPGLDDVRLIDWSVTARTGQPHVRATVAEHELETWVLVDGSASMDFGTAVMEKRELAAAVVAALGALTDAPGNRLGARVLTGAGLGTHRPRGGRLARRALLRDLLDAPRTAPGPGAGAELAAGLERFGREHRRPGLRVVVSDFLDDSPWEAPMRRLTARHEVLAVGVVDPRDRRLPDVGALVLVDPETGRRREVRTDPRLRARFAQASAAHAAATSAAVRRAGAEHLELRTDGDWVTDLARFVAGRRRMRRGKR
ncbi:DUF58 domain-containing protein [Pseudonocardia humida]|uniref:DUF58 domain-containing protein n=1 Tax=Pseudonocardia humida TaxID=2800819 RepID=A0ABT0ZY44_9PSEU|nr:DUF58 domain-containing protein [Pseudonocardia humida]MCO1655667.1 DUF58 domain-containing protein [Pseudonocardia humida]